MDYELALIQINKSTQVYLWIFSRPGWNQGLLYKHFRHWLINSVSQPFPPTTLRRRHVQTVRDSTSSYKIDYVIVIKNFLNPEEHQNPFSGSKVTAILLKGRILSIVGASAGEGLPCSLILLIATSNFLKISNRGQFWGHRCWSFLAILAYSNVPKIQFSSICFF